MKSHSVKSIAQKLKRARLEKGLTQSALAILLDVPQSYIAKIEAGGTDLRSSTLMEITKLLDLELVFVPLGDLPKVAMILADDADQRQIHRSAYEPDEDDDDEEND